MSSTSAIQLTELDAPGASTAWDTPLHNTQHQQQQQVSQRKLGGRSTDEVLQESRVADSEVPEGGYGWVIVLAGAVQLWWSLGTTYAWGVMQAALVEQGLASPATLSFIGSLQAALISALAIVNSTVMRRLGARWTCVLGAAFMGMSEIMASFTVHNIGGLFFCSGVLKGVGVSLSFVVIAAVPSQYFSKRRGLANGVMFAGSGFGGAANSFILDALIQSLGASWAYRIMGIMTLATALPTAWLIKERVPLNRKGIIEWSLFRSLTFVLVFFGSAIGTFPLFVPPFFIPLFTKSLGFSSSTGAGLVAGFSLASAFGRIGSGVMSDKLGSLNTVFASLILTAVTNMAVWPQSTTLAPMVVFVVINGAANGAFFSTMPTAVSHCFGSARVAVAMSMVVTGWIGGYLMGAPIAGYLLGAYGGTEGGLQAYRPAMFYAGSLALVSSVMIIAARLRINKAILGKG